LSNEHLATLMYQKENCVIHLEGRVSSLLFLCQYAAAQPTGTFMNSAALHEYYKFQKSVDTCTIYCFYSNNIITICNNNNINKSFNFLYKDKGHFQIYLPLRSDFRHPHS